MQLLAILLQTRALAPLLGAAHRQAGSAPAGQATTSPAAPAGAPPGGDARQGGRTAPPRDRVEITAAAIRLLSTASEGGSVGSRSAPPPGDPAGPGARPAEAAAPAPAPAPAHVTPPPGIPEPIRTGAPAPPALPGQAETEDVTTPGPGTGAASAADSPASPTAPPFQIGLSPSAPWRRHPWLPWAALAALAVAALVR